MLADAGSIPAASTNSTTRPSQDGFFVATFQRKGSAKGVKSAHCTLLSILPSIDLLSKSPGAGLRSLIPDLGTYSRFKSEIAVLGAAQGVSGPSSIVDPATSPKFRSNSLKLLESHGIETARFDHSILRVSMRALGRRRTRGGFGRARSGRSGRRAWEPTLSGLCGRPPF